jgi:signal transduction histidine kinase
MKFDMPASSDLSPMNRRSVDPSPPLPMNDQDQSINILLVDDEVKNLTVLETILDDPGYRLVRAASADEALLALVREEFGLIILDIQMPGMTGFELAQMIKQRKKTAGVPIIFLTAYYSESEHILEGYGSGAVDYLHKPVNAAILRSKVAIFASLHRTTKEASRNNESLLLQISERRRVEQQLLQLNNELEERVEQRTSELTEAHRRKDEFLAILAHELRNPLAPIRNAVQILKMNQISEIAPEGIIEMMDRQVRHLIRLVDDLLDVSRVMEGKIELRKEMVNLLSVIGDAVDTARPLIDNNGQELKIHVPREPLQIDADPVRLTQIIGNLLMNAAKYTPFQGRIDLTAECVENEIELRVRDSGIGIDPRMLDRIFDLFVQVDHTATRSQGGLGIGLTLVKNLVEMHRGSVTATSAGLGKGSEFIIRLPLVSGSDDDLAAAEKHEDNVPTPRRQLLVVDDNKDSADSLAVLLRLFGHNVQVAYDGHSALDLAARFSPDGVFLDIGMPVMDGFQVARELRSIAGLEDTILTAVTGWGQQEDRRRTAEAGFDHHLVKPVDPKAVEMLLRDFKSGRIIN